MLSVKKLISLNSVVITCALATVTTNDKPGSAVSNNVNSCVSCKIFSRFILQFTYSGVQSLAVLLFLLHRPSVHT